MDNVFSIPKPYFIPNRGHFSFDFKKEMVDKSDYNSFAFDLYASNLSDVKGFFRFSCLLSKRKYLPTFILWEGFTN